MDQHLLSVSINIFFLISLKMVVFRKTEKWKKRGNFKLYNLFPDAYLPSTMAYLKCSTFYRKYIPHTLNLFALIGKRAPKTDYPWMSNDEHGIMSFLHNNIFWFEEGVWEALHLMDLYGNISFCIPLELSRLTLLT